MEVRLLCCCVGSDLSDELITLSEKSYLCVCLSVCLSLIVCDLGAPTVRRPRPRLGWLRYREKENLVIKGGEDDHGN